MKPRKPRTVYSNDYYRMEKLVADPLFQERVSWLRAEYEKHGIPLPARGFKTYDGYMRWIDKFWKRLFAVESSQEMKDRIKVVAPNPMMTSEEYDSVEEIRGEMLPPVPGEFKRQLLREFCYNPRDEKLGKFLDGYIFFGKKHLSENRFTIRWSRNKKSDEWELWLRIFPYTKREDVQAFWGEIVKAQKMSVEYVGKSKSWKTFERDLEIYKTWHKIANGKKRHHGKKTWVEAMVAPLDHLVYGELHKKYPRLTLVQIRNAKKRIGELETGKNV